MTIAPSSPAGSGEPSTSRTSTRKPGTGTEGEPGLSSIGSRPRRFAAIGNPVSVCHQWSITGTPSFSVAQW